MAKTPRFHVSGKPAKYSPGNAEGVASIISPPTRHRAPDNTYTETKGAKLYKKRGGALATRVITRSLAPEIRVVNIRENVWRNGF